MAWPPSGGNSTPPVLKHERRTDVELVTSKPGFIRQLGIHDEKRRVMLIAGIDVDFLDGVAGRIGEVDMGGKIAFMFAFQIDFARFSCWAIADPIIDRTQRMAQQDIGADRGKIGIFGPRHVDEDCPGLG